ncbi:unnamed protein product [Bursaphelenchus xylophilus]|uniref:ubiquitinyl hydrolase 1 n=1 Tax=Bursaphelenchus xylophilus TaxID=6326 RepID=A0A1I7SMC0_BURXY|nr:unnamed protein product [Bursaphelenchus xylophilus]CAG9130101.1 unnamed protein product [Bursaphelenchus xylophilus]
MSGPVIRPTLGASQRQDRSPLVNPPNPVLSSVFTANFYHSDQEDRMGGGGSRNRSSSGHSEPEYDGDRSSDSRSSSQSENSNRSLERRGFENLGNTCFLSALLEALSSLPEFVKCLDKVTDEMPRHHQAEYVEDKTYFQFSLLYELSRMLCAIRKSDVAPSAKKFYKYVGKLEPSLAGRQQQDAHELYLMIMDAFECICKVLDEDAKKIGRFANPRFESNCFYFWTQRRIKCSECSNESCSKEPSVNVSVDLPEDDEIDWNPWKAWGRKFEFTGNNKYKCDKCNKKVDATQFTDLLKPPPVLVVHYHVFQMVDVDGNVHLQKRSKVPFPPESIHLSDFNVVPASQTDLRDYVLCSMVIHIGSNMHCGHYVAAKRIQSDDWVVYDDDVTFERKTVDLMSTSSRHTPYLMFYRRKNYRPRQRNAAGEDTVVRKNWKENKMDEEKHISTIGTDVSGMDDGRQKSEKRKIPTREELESLTGRWQKMATYYLQEWFNFIFSLKASKSLGFLKKDDQDGPFNGFDDII